MSHSILRRYTPPTCTLEIMAKNSPLSRWAGQPVLKHLQFQLRLDDPKQPEEQWLTLRGDRGQLEALYEAVTTYVQQFLEQSFDLETWRHRHEQENVTSPAEGAIAVLPTLEQNEPPSLAAPNSTAISLQQKGLLTHRLVLGSLAAPDATGIVSLSTLQLFDLANALDEYHAEMVALPDMPRSRQLMSSSPHWGQLAATSLLVIGLSASVAKIIDSSSKPASPTASQEDSSNDQKTAQAPPAIELSPPLALREKLPVSPGSTVPASPGLPTFPLVSPPPSLTANKPPVAATSLKPIPAGSSQRKDASNQIAMSPLENRSSAPTRSRPVQPMPKPLTLNREFADAPPSQSTDASTARSAARSEGAQASQNQTDTAFDSIPQIAEARQYFQQRWSPPQGFTQTLEYTLLVSANGSIQRVVPLGQAAEDNVSQTGIPSSGQAFISALTDGRNAKIRLVLSPDGSVKTFLEGFY